MLKVLSEIPLPARPDPILIGNLVEVLRDILAEAAEGTTVAYLLTRPGVGAITKADRDWSSVLTTVSADVGIPIEPVFRANDERLVLVEPG